MKLEVNGVQYTGFTKARCQLRLDTLSSSFEFEATATDGQPLPFKGGESCRVIVDNVPVLTGAIEIVAVNYDGGDHTISVSGRDRTADLLDSTIDTIDDIRGEGLTLKVLIEKVIDHLGLDLIVIDQANPDPFNAAEDVVAPEPGENAFAFIEKYSRKRQVLLTSDAGGNIVIAANSGIVAAGAVQHIIGAEDNNVLRSDFSFDRTGRFNLYKMSSGLNPIALNLAGDTGTDAVVNQSGQIIDSAIKAGRQMVLVSETPFSDGSCSSRAKWEADIRRARGLIYSATVPGFRVGGDTGSLWQINRIYRIVDDFVGKSQSMLLNSLEFSFDVDSGRETALGFVGKETYQSFIEPDPTGEVASDVA